jgi:hypothetical protein
MTPATLPTFEQIEGVFHDGLGTFAELRLANELVAAAQIPQKAHDERTAIAKMNSAISRLPPNHPARSTFTEEMLHVGQAAELAAGIILQQVPHVDLERVDNVAKHFSGARAGDVHLVFRDRRPESISVKTDKSDKVAIADGQTPDIFGKWASRFFSLSEPEFSVILQELGFESLDELKSYYLNVAEFAVEVIIRKLHLINCTKTDLSHARMTEIEPARDLFAQLLRFKKGSDGSRVVILDRRSGQVKWETLLDTIDLGSLTVDDVSFRPSRPQGGRRVGSEFGVKVSGKAVATFQVKHKRGKNRETARKYEFGDITTRLMI